jgi:hygromycin-B 4-O-kinase
VTRPVVDQAQAAAFLSVRFGPGVSGVARIGQGEWSQAYAFRRDGGDFVVRFSRYGEDFAKDRLAGAYASPALPVPRITEIGEAFGGAFAVSERAFGEHLDGLEEAEARRALPAIFAALDAARSADVSGSKGFGMWRAGGDAPFTSWEAALLEVGHDRPGDRTHGWRARLDTSPTGAAAFREAYHQMAALIASCPCPERRHLVHADLLNNNLLVADGRVAAVIDWGCAMYGDFLYDLALLSFSTPFFPAIRGIDFRAEARRHYARIGLEVPRFEERLRCYETHVGLGALSYTAFTGRWSEHEALARRTLAVATGRA